MRASAHADPRPEPSRAQPANEPGPPGGAPLRRLRDVPADERPRERLARLGPSALSARELIALLLGTGRRGASALDVADDVLGAGLRELALSSLGDLERRRGLGRAKATRLLAAMELGARVASVGRQARPYFGDSRQAGRYLLPLYGSSSVEVFGALLLDVRHRLVRELVVSIGCLTGSLVHPREVFKEAVVSRAAYVLLFHNHPSGDPEPSDEDARLTKRLVEAGVLLGVEVVDHLILGAGGFISLRQRGLL
jgi:DNA repair protein RadC